MKRVGPNSDQSDLPSGRTTVDANPAFTGISIFIYVTPLIASGSIVAVSLEDSSNTVALGDLVCSGTRAADGNLNVEVYPRSSPYNLTHAIQANWIVLPPK
jgi:hypothetical protein